MLHTSNEHTMLHWSRRKWCKKRALEEQRLIEMAKLRAQFEGILAEAGLRARPSGSGAHGSGMAGRRWGSEGGGPQGRRCCFRQCHAVRLHMTTLAR